MNGEQFRRWRDRVGLTQQQVAEKLKITRTTIQNWESDATPIPRAVEMSSDIWEARLKQENAELGPVTLIYSDGPMFINPYGPRRRPAMMQQEAYASNAWALARVQQLWGRSDFQNPMIIEESGKPLWNVVELGRVADGSDTGAPTLINMLRAIAKNVRENASHFVRGPAIPTPTEIKRRQKDIEAQADKLEDIAAAGMESAVKNQSHIEEVFRKLLALGTRAPDRLVSNVSQALVVFERDENQPRLEQGGYVLDHRGYEISYPRVPLDSSGWTVNIASNNPRLLNKLGGTAMVVKDHQSLERAISKAKVHIDSML